MPRLYTFLLLLTLFSLTAATALAEPVKLANPYEDGVALPADGGEAGKVLLAAFAAIQAKDYNKARGLLGMEDKDSIFYKEDKDMKLLFCNSAKAKKAMIAGGFSRDNEVTLYVDFSGVEQSTVQMTKEEGGWRMSGCGGYWP